MFGDYFLKPMDIGLVGDLLLRVINPHSKSPIFLILLCHIEQLGSRTHNGVDPVTGVNKKHHRGNGK